MEEINREFPLYQKLLSYPFRYKKDIFIKYNELLKNEQLQNDYKKWKLGINYTTNRKITIRGKIHNKLKNKFEIENGIFFSDIEDINFEKYVYETNCLYIKIDDENIEIKKYNDEVTNIVEKIKKLNSWEEYIIFEEKKYGIPKVYNNIHRENNCFGNMTCERQECTCSTCENWRGCGSKGTKYYKCNLCNYSFYKNLGYYCLYDYI